MKGAYLSELNELARLTAVGLNDDVYGVAFVTEMENCKGRKTDIGSISPGYAELRRLGSKGYATSRLDGAIQAQGGRSRRIYTLAKSGPLTLGEANTFRTRLSQRIKPVAS
ncbi:MAG: hypothetical protein AAGA85_12370 [Bacteroidota bacterium]